MRKLKTFTYIQRYFLISCLAFSIDYLLALILIHFGLAAEISLAAATITGSWVGYFGLELWGFRTGRAAFSLKRYLKYCLGVLAIYLVRVLLLKIIYALFGHETFRQEAVCLFISYLFAFVAGYLIQSLFVFKIYKRNG